MAAIYSFVTLIIPLYKRVIIVNLVKQPRYLRSGEQGSNLHDLTPKVSAKPLGFHLLYYRFSLALIERANG
jgi:hypothetical protein